MKYLLKKDKAYFVKKFKELKPDELKALSSNFRIKIINELKKEPMYPNKLAKKLKMHEQKVYYHINELKKAGILTISRTEEIKGSLANYYTVKEDAFGIELEGDYEKISLKKTPNNLRKLFKEFVAKGKLEGFIVVGSPLPHGPFKAVAGDGHYSAQLGLLLGELVSTSGFHVKLDTDVINEKKLQENLIIIGGPGTNLITAQVNEHLPVRFNEDNYWKSIKSRDKEYTDEACGLIIKIKNPFNKDKTILLLAGLKKVGTKSCIIALTKPKELLKGYDEGTFVKIIKGFDFDGDGKVDGVEILE